MRNPKYHIYLTPDERRTVINSLIDLRNDFISQGKYIDIIDELFINISEVGGELTARQKVSINDGMMFFEVS